MIRLNILAIGLVSILALTGCKTAETPPTAESAGKAVTDAAGAAKDKATDAAGAAKDKAADAAGAAKDKVADVAGAAKDKVAGVAGAVAAPGMANVAGIVTKTKAAIDAGDLEQAKSEMSKFEDSWSKVEKGVKANSPAAYDAIETNAKSAQSAVNNEDKAKALAALKALGAAVASAKP
jgi:high-affinity Fe2+/Pb2+ permease